MEETGSWRGVAGSEVDLRRSSREAREKSKERRLRLTGVDACLVGQAIQEWKRRGEIG